MVIKDYSIDEIKVISQKKKIVFFGAGFYYNLFEERFRASLSGEKVSCIIDNDKNKQRETRMWGNASIPIVSLEAFCKNDNVDTLLILTIANGYDVFMDLQKISSLQGMECSYCKFILSKALVKSEEQRKCTGKFRKTQEPLIPPVIHYCWFGKGSIPQKNLEWIDTWKRYNPNFEVICWDESNYDFSWSPYMKEAYEKERWGFVPDVARMDIIYRYGGIYLDTDVEIIRSFEDLRYQKCFFGTESFGNFVSPGLGFGAVPQHPLIRKLRDIYEGLHFLQADGKINLTTSPEIQKKCFEDIGYVFDGELFETEEVTIYPEWVLSPKDNFSGDLHIKDYTFSIHHFDSSWADISMKDRWLEDGKLKKLLSPKESIII